MVELVENWLLTNKININNLEIQIWTKKLFLGTINDEAY